MANKRMSARERDTLFQKTVSNETSNSVNNETNNLVKEETRRQTYFLTSRQIKALALKAAFEDADKSEIVRKALDAYIDKKYFDMADAAK